MKPLTLQSSRPVVFTEKKENRFMDIRTRRPARLVLAGMLALSATCASAQLLTSIYSFDNATNDFNLTAGLLLSGNTLYGTAAGGTLPSGGKGAGPVSGGAVFKLNTDGTGFTNLYIFSSAYGSVAFPSVTNTDGANSFYAPQLVSSGNRLYGTTDRGGFYASGTIFAINTDGSGFTNLHNFTTYASIDT